MADTSNLTNFLQDVADAIKEKKEYPSSQKIAAADFDTEIAGINTINNQDKTVTENGSYTADTGYTGLGTVTVNVDSIPDGIFIQESTPTKTTDEAFWLKDDDLSNMKLNLNELSDTILNESITLTTTGEVVTIQTMINNMTTQEKNAFNSYTYHIIGHNIDTTNRQKLVIFGSNTKPRFSNDSGAYRLLPNSNSGFFYYYFDSGVSSKRTTFSTSGIILDWLSSMPYYLLVVDDKYQSGTDIIPNNISDYIVETGLHIDVDDKRYIAYKAGLNESFNKILDTSNANATANDILSGKTAFVNNEKLTGTYVPLDTSDATATSSDICAPRTAYVNGQKIEGLIYTITNASTENMEALQILPEYGNPNTMQMDCIGFRAQPAAKHHLPICWKDNSNMDIYCTHSNLATAINLTPEILKSGETVLGVVGNYSGGGSTENLENVISEQENIIANLSNLVNTKAGTSFVVPDGMKFAQSTISTLPEFDTSNVTDMSNMFHNCIYLTAIPNLNTSNVIYMSSMFLWCRNLTSVSNFDTSNVINMSHTFDRCENLTSIPNYNTGKVKDMGDMFANCRNLTSIPNFDTSNVTNMDRMFHFCQNLTDVPDFNTGKVTNISNMFGRCNDLSETSLQNIINMCLNSNVTSASYKNLSNANYYSPFYQTNITNAKYSNRLAELDAAGWTY